MRDCIRTPSDWGRTFLMNFPLSVSNRVCNNVLMDGLRAYNKEKACQQWMELYRYLSGEGLVYILPAHDDLQDLPFVANLGCYLPHMLADVVLISNFTSEPRRGEAFHGKRFFQSFDYVVMQSPYKWEGEADLKWVRDDIYVGGVGQRSTKEAYQWMSVEFGMNITTVNLTDPKLYHLDCAFLPLDSSEALVATSALSDDDTKKLEKIVDIIEVPKHAVHDGWCNGLVIGDTVLHGSSDYDDELAKLLYQHGYGIEVFDLSEFDKSGADLSCLVMHLNYD